MVLPMRILQLISTIRYYGAESVVSGLSRELHAQNHSTVVSTLTRVEKHSDVITEKAARWGIPAFDIACLGRADWHALRTLRRLIRDQEITLIHSHNYKSNLYAYLATYRGKLPLVATCHNWTRSTKSLRMYAALDHFLLRGFDRVVAVSDLVAENLRHSRLPADRISVIPNGIEVRDFEAVPAALHPKEDDQIAIGAVCRLTPEKGVPDLLFVAKALMDRHPRVRLVIAGDGPDRHQFETLAGELGIAAKVKFLGFQSDMPAIYASMDIFVLPSWNEGMPMSVLEAMAAAKPIVASRVGAIPKLVSNEAGILIEPGDRNALQTALEKLIADKDLRLAMGKAGRQSVAATFGIQKMTEAYLQV